MRLHAEVEIRRCRGADLPNLEWYGMFAAHREVIREAFSRQQRGEVAMLLGILGGFPVAQLWLDFHAASAPGAGRVWAFRVFPFLRGRGLGSTLLSVAEDELQRRGFSIAEVGVDPSNPGAMRLYERAGYRWRETVVEDFAYVHPSGQQVRERIEQHLLTKRLTTVSRGDAGRGAGTSARGTGISTGPFHSA